MGKWRTYGLIDGSVLASTKGHVGNGTLRAVASLRVLGSEIDAGNDTREGSLDS